MADSVDPDPRLIPLRRALLALYLVFWTAVLCFVLGAPLWLWTHRSDIPWLGAMLPCTDKPGSPECGAAAVLFVAVFVLYIADAFLSFARLGLPRPSLGLVVLGAVLDFLFFSR